MSVRSLTGAMMAALLLVVGAGCGNRLVSVRGTVTLDGTPVEGAMVLFIPESENAGRQASGQTGPDGNFRLTTLRDGDGAFPGNYKVAVQYTEGIEAPPSKNMREAFEGLQKAKPKGPPRYVIPERYSNPGKTELRQKVPADGTVKLELKSK
jgi:hypothetical protein